ncbi:MAG: hypothetical protein JO264_07170 [Acidisphaera sp.]|nr:hypothetical protein [Acidisphaera sp.]
MAAGRTAVAAGLQAALLLARGRPEGLAYVDTALPGAARSFWAAAICLPIFAFLRVLDWSDGAMPANPGHAFALDALGYAIGWAGFALASRPLAARLGRADRWPHFIAAWNWCNVAQYVLLLAAAVPEIFGAPAIVQQVVGLVALGWALWLEWYATKLTLDVPPLPAIALVALDVAIGVLIAGVTGALG